MSNYHIPVMPKESIEYLNIQKGCWYIDCNLGGGGHTDLILQAGGKVIGLDLDPDAIREVAKNHQLEVHTVGDHLEARSETLIIYQSNFAAIDQVISELRNKTRDAFSVQGIFFDLGVSTHQLDTPERGFSFNSDAPLDMRMNSDLGVTASDLVNGLYEKELADLFWKFGEENFSRPIAKKIVEYRKTNKIETTNTLANIILSVRRRSLKDRTHPATRVFQALRIVVNDELNSLTTALPKAFEILSPGGRLVVLSFHSLEDRIAKTYFNDWAEKNVAKIITKKPIETSEEESIKNPRARSAKLRCLEKS
jgi:16S rRNA (cytosine1402-N4)-methyltransferase